MRGRRSPRDPDRIRFPQSALWLVLLLALLGTGAVVWGVDHAEGDLTLRAEAALAAAGIEASVDFHGRDARLSGSVPSEDEFAAAVSLLSRLTGVREVDASRLSVAVPPPPPPPPPVASTAVELQIDVDAGLAVVTGSVRDERDAAAIRAAAVIAYGPTAVEDELVVSSDVVAAPWLPDVAAAVSRLGSMGQGTVRIAEAGIVLEGIVPTEEAVGDIVAAFGRSGLFVDNRLLVGTLALPSVHLARREPGGMVAVGGILFDQATVTAFMTQAVATYGANDVVDETVLGLVDDPPLLGDIAALIPLTKDLVTWQIALDDGVLTVRGEADDERALEAPRAAIDELRGAGLTVVPALELTAEAVGSRLTALFASVETFAAGGSDLTQAAQALVPEAVALLNENPSARLVVEGHTDSTGDAGANEVVSQARAEAIMVSLVAGGVEAGRLIAIGYGENRPIASNATEEGRAMNRRIEFVPREDE